MNAGRTTVTQSSTESVALSAVYSLNAGCQALASAVAAHTQVCAAAVTKITRGASSPGSCISCSRG